MIRGHHTAIRTAEPDDAPYFQELYRGERPRSALLSRTRELVQPTIDEIREAFGPAAEKAGGGFYIVEDLTGQVRGFCALRTSQELRDSSFYAELVVMMRDPADFAGPVAHETLQWLLRRAFTEQRLNKVVTHAFECETELADWYRTSEFESNGIQRDIMYARGQWHSLETFTRYNPERFHGAAVAGAGHTES